MRSNTLERSAAARAIEAQNQRFRQDDPYRDCDLDMVAPCGARTAIGGVCDRPFDHPASEPCRNTLADSLRI